MPLLSKIPSGDREEGAFKSGRDQHVFEDLIFLLELTREEIKLYGWRNFDLDDIKELVAVLRILARAMWNDLDLTEEEAKALEVINKWTGAGGTHKGRERRIRHRQEERRHLGADTELERS